jgi:DNA-binding transcriptional ArsR family regulator
MRMYYCGAVTVRAQDPFAKAAELFKALSAPTRLGILQRLNAGPACVHELVQDLGISQPLASQHLRVLRAADLVRGTRRGREIAYEVADHHVSHLVADALSHANEVPALPIDPLPNPEEQVS